ncbi:MAG TPA: glycosyltransferase [Desulfobacteraceae bacterium]|nr:glycosyltransferase [Desulfobacteraceae bacterium]HPJ67543.1 glycosyltransferase [Desulfobacteraceae bacterium]HPQ28492.1 glycosyltransferase [Desulfobacteraceae bacterium]
MKILMFIDGLRAGGKERQLIQLVKGLASKKNFKCEIAVMNTDVHYKKVYDLNVRIHFLIRRIKMDPLIFYRLYKICKEFEPDIIHTCDSLTSLYATPIARLLRIKLINGMIRSAPLYIDPLSAIRFVKTITFPFADRILANSQAGLRSYKVKSKGTYIHNGFDFSRIQKIENTENVKEQIGIKTDKTVGMVASFTNNKDYETYIYAAKTILQKRDDVTFLAIGNGINFNKIKELAGNTERIKLPGVHEDVESIINILNIGVLSTYTEGISNSIMEYMALGKPVIAVDGGGTNELVIDGETGFLVKQRSPAELTEKLEYLLDNEKIAEQMGVKGKRRIETEFSLEKMADKYLELYEELIKK